MDVEDFKKATIPQLILPSGNQPTDEVEAYKKELTVHSNKAVTTKSHIEVYDKMVHGWMAARAQLAEEETRKGYERGYEKVVTFLGDNL